MASKAVVRPASLHDVFVFAPLLRKEDREEVWAAAHHRPAHALLTAVQGSAIACSAWVGNEPLLMFGIGVIAGIDGLPDCGVPWALTTDAVSKYPVTFWKVTSHALAGFRERWPVMVQVIDKRHKRSIAWARQLGFTALKPIPFGPEGRLFVPITLGGCDVRPDSRRDRNAAARRDRQSEGG